MLSSLWHTNVSDECTKERIPGLPKFGSMESCGARAEKRNVLRKKTAADVLPASLLSGLFFVFFWQCNKGGVQCSRGSSRPPPPRPPSKSFFGCAECLYSIYVGAGSLSEVPALPLHSTKKGAKRALARLFTYSKTITHTT